MRDGKPNSDEAEADDNLQRYVDLAIEIEASLAAASRDLTETVAKGSVSEGLVDPTTPKSTG